MLDGDRGLLVVTARQAGLMPGGLCVVDPAAYRGLRDRLRADAPSALQRWVHDNGALIDDVDLQLGPTAVDPKAVHTMRALLRAETTPAPNGAIPVGPIRALAPRLVRAATAHPMLGTDALRAELAAVVGAGPGTTPTGDDVIVGVLAGLRAVGHDAAARRIASRLPELLTGTTRASAHYLSAACRGEFGEHVHDLVAALADPASVPAALAQARRWGATSGIDLAHGLAAAARSDRSVSRPTERIT